MTSTMRLCVLGLLCLHSSVFGQEAPGFLMFCDDLSVMEAAISAVQKFNEKMSSGNKLALFQILTASKSKISSGSVFSLQFSSRRSDCPAGSSKPWTDCDYLPVNRKPFSCNATVYMTETGADTRQVACLLDDIIVPERATCLGCPVDIDENSEELKVPLSVSIAKYNSISNSPHLFTLHSVGLATRQVVAGFRFKVRFDMRKTTCAKTEHNDLSDLCVPNDQDVEFANCNSTVDVAPWRLEPPEAHVECEAGALPIIFTRSRRPPGWSPLRNYKVELHPPTPPSLTKAAAKDESSEEDASATKTSSADSPFHCPSKPWKPFDPHRPAAPSKEAVEATTKQPSADGAFSDTDLLG